MLTRKAFLALLLAFFILVLPGNTPHAIRYAIVALIITSWAIVARFNAGYILELSSVAFSTGCRKVTTNHFITGGADFTQRRIGWVGERIVFTIGGHRHAFCRHKSIAVCRNTRRVEV
jgi:hypothetical protein